MEYPLLPIPGWEGLYAAQGDQVISLRSGKPLKPILSGCKYKKYHSVKLCVIGHKPKHMRVHRAILSAKLGRHIAEGMDVDHIDNNPLNNFPENLRELTRSENIQAGYEFKRKMGKTSTNHRGVRKHQNGYCVEIGIEGLRLYVGTCKNYNTACKMADDAFAGIFPLNVKLRLEKLKEKNK